MATAKKVATKKPAAKKAVKKAAEKPVEKPVKAAVKKATKAESPAPKAKKAAKAEPIEVVVEAPAKKPAKKAAAESGALPAHVETILAAIREGRALEFIFSDADANAPRTFEPRQVAFDALSQAWFVWGWDRRYNAERYHRVDLLAEVNAVEGVGRSAQGPYKEGTPGNQIGGWLGGEPIHVKVLLHKQWVFAVKQAPPAFPEFKMVEAEDGKSQVTFTATDLRAIARWVLQFGDGVTIQEPARLLDRVKQVASVWLGKDAGKPSARPEPAPRQEHRSESRHEPRHEGRSERKHEERPERKHEDRPERKHEDRSEGRPERHREQHHREREAKPETKSSNPKVEIRFDRL